MDCCVVKFFSVLGFCVFGFREFVLSFVVFRCLERRLFGLRGFGVGICFGLVVRLV